MSDIFSFLPVDMFSLVIKIIVIVVIGLYTLFVFVIFNHIRSLKRIVIIHHASGSPFIQTLALLYLLFSIFLFLAAIVIL